MKVTLESKYDVGQEVYFLEDEELRKRQIDCIKFCTYENCLMETVYYSTNGSAAVESQIFESVLDYRRTKLDEARTQYQIELDASAPPKKP